MSETLSRVVGRMLAERIGLDPSSVGEALIVRGVRQRMAALGLRTPAEYDRALVDRADEAQALVEEVVVPESWFFRDDRPFELLAEFARGGWCFDPARPPLSILSIPCAGGEEPYSIAMTLLEAGLPLERFRVDAADVSERSLARAIAGVYSSNAFRGSPARSGYFRGQNGGFTVDSSLRASVRFHLGNLLDPTLFADRPPFDAVFCRNLLIYFDDDSKARGFAALDRLTADGGLLFLGHADRLDAPDPSPFDPTGDRGAFAYRKGGAKPKSKALAPQRFSSPLPAREGPGLRGVARPPAPRKADPDGRRYQGDAPHPGPLPEGEGGRKRPEPAASEPGSSILDRASSLADLGRYDEAMGLLEGSIRDGGAGAGAYFLLGLIAQGAGRRDLAEAHLLKAIYLDPNHDEALLALALLARRKGDIAGEAAYRKRAERVLSRKAIP